MEGGRGWLPEPEVADHFTISNCDIDVWSMKWTISHDYRCSRALAVVGSGARVAPAGLVECHFLVVVVIIRRSRARIRVLCSSLCAVEMSGTDGERDKGRLLLLLLLLVRYWMSISTGHILKSKSCRSVALDGDRRKLQQIGRAHV